MWRRKAFVVTLAKIELHGLSIFMLQAIDRLTAGVRKKLPSLIKHCTIKSIMAVLSLP